MWSPAIGRNHAPQTSPPPHRQTPRSLLRPPGRPHRAAPTKPRWVGRRQKSGLAGSPTGIALPVPVAPEQGASLHDPVIVLDADCPDQEQVGQEEEEGRQGKPDHASTSRVRCAASLPPSPG